MKNINLSVLTCLTLLCNPNMTFSQAPGLGTASDFSLFTAVGAFDNVGPSVITGDIGTDDGAFNGIPPGTVSGEIHVADATSGQAAIDVEATYMELTAIPCDSLLAVSLGLGQILTANVYCLGGASTVTGDLTLDAQDDPDAVFIFKINGTFITGLSSKIILINSASANNVYWQVNGAFDLGDSSVFMGNAVVNGAISLLNASSLYGRGLSKAGAISLLNSLAEKPIVVLPILLVSFNADKCEAQPCINLTWQTASEVNCDYFLIERAADGINFKTIGKSDGAGNSNQLLSYLFTDEGPEEGINYYRLNQFDYDGQNEYVSTRVATFFKTNAARDIFPNPFTTFIVIVMNETGQIDNCALKINNVLGEEVMHTAIVRQVTTLDTSDLPSGNYFYNIISNGRSIRAGTLVAR